MQTIAGILRESSGFSSFIEALRFTRVLDFLDKEDVSRTLYLPTNEAFSSQIPQDLFECLMYMRLPLSDLVLHHLVRGAEYTSSLSLREFTHTLLPQQAIRLTTNDSGVITFRTDPPSTIITPNISASNGVIHIVDAVLIPPNMDFGMCDDFVPTTPTTSPPITTTAAATTTEAETTPITEEMTTPPSMTTAPPTGLRPIDLDRNP